MEKDQKELKIRLEQAVEPYFGKRCEVADIVDFPDLIDNPLASRCPICLAYEKVDRFTKELIDG